MNSVYSQANNSGLDCCPGNHHRRRDDDEDRSNRNRENRDSILRANTGTFGPANIPILATLLNPTINEPIASVTINTEDLEDPTILVQFNGVLTTTATIAAGLTFVFTLYRSCRGNGQREQLRSFTVSQVTAALGLPDSRGLSFAFNQSDEDCNHHECCTYTLELTRVTSTVAVNLNVTVTGTLSVLAVSDED